MTKLARTGFSRCGTALPQLSFGPLGGVYSHNQQFMKSAFFTIAFCLIGCYPTLPDPYPHNYSSEGLGMGWGLELLNDSTYNYWYFDCSGSSYGSGYWRRSGDTLLLNSFVIPRIVSIKETLQVDESSLRIDVVGSDNKEYFLADVYHNTVDSVYKIKWRLDVGEEFKKSNYEDVRAFYQIPKLRLQRLGRHFTIQIDDYPLAFSMHDTLANRIIVRLNVAKGKSSYRQPTYFKDRQIYIRGDSLFNGDVTSHHFPAIRGRVIH